MGKFFGAIGKAVKMAICHNDQFLSTYYLLVVVAAAAVNIPTVAILWTIFCENSEQILLPQHHGVLQA